MTLSSFFSKMDGQNDTVKVNPNICWLYQVPFQRKYNYEKVSIFCRLEA